MAIRRKKKRDSRQDSALAQQRLEMILQVRSGQITATDAAKRLNVSRKTYYEWEAGGLQGMLESLSNQSSGRPAKMIDPEKQELEKQVQDLEKELNLTAAGLAIKEFMFHGHKNWSDEKKKE